MFLGILQVLFYANNKFPTFILRTWIQTPLGAFDEPMGLRGAYNQKVAWKEIWMFLGQIKGLFYARPPNSQLLFGKQETDPSFRLLMSL